MSEYLEAHYIPIGEALLRIAAAALCGFILGIDRELKKKPVGLRTYMLVAVGAAAFTVTGMELAHQSVPETNRIDPGRVIEGIIGAFGFLGAGAIIRSGGDRLSGMASGAATWVTGSLGVACGLGLFWLAFPIAFGAAAVLFVLEFIQGHTHAMKNPNYSDEGGTHVR